MATDGELKNHNMQFFLLDLLRGFAALWVFSLHYEFSESFQTLWPNLHSFTQLGDLGVPMFFVISGYCITASAKSAMRRDLPTRQFVYRRLKRIFPPFWLSVAFVAGLPFVIEFLSSLKTGVFVAPNATNSNYGFLNYNATDWFKLVSLTQIFWPANELSPLHDRFASINAVYWTLAIEVQFYLVLAIALKLKPSRFYAALACFTLISIPVAALGWLILSGLCLPFWPMFALGILLYFMHERDWTLQSLAPRKAQSLSVVLTPLIVCAFFIAASYGFRPHLFAFTAAFATWLWIAKPSDNLLLNLRDHRRTNWLMKPMIALGAMSYSVYLIHGQLNLLAAQCVRQILPSDNSVFDFTVIVATCLLCWPFYKLCEEPFFKARQQGNAENTQTPQVALST